MVIIDIGKKIKLTTITKTIFLTRLNRSTGLNCINNQILVILQPCDVYDVYGTFLDAPKPKRSSNSSLPYIHFVTMPIVAKLIKQYYIQPYLVGKDKRSLAMVLPSEMVKSLDIDPLTILFLLKVEGHDELQLRIIRQEHLEKKDTENAIPVIEQEVGHQ